MIPIGHHKENKLKKQNYIYIYICEEINYHDKNVEVHDNVTFKFKSKINAVSSRVGGVPTGSSLSYK